MPGHYSGSDSVGGDSDLNMASGDQYPAHRARLRVQSEQFVASPVGSATRVRGVVSR